MATNDYATRVVDLGSPEASFETLLASAARTTTTTSDIQTNVNHRGVHVVVDVTSITLTPSLTPKIEAYDPVSGQWYTLLEGAAITTVSTTVLRVYPGLTESANAKASDALPQSWRVTVTHADTDSATYSVAANLLV